MSVPKSKAFRDKAEECRLLAELFHSERTRFLLLRIAAQYERMSDQAAMFELEEADRAAPAEKSSSRAHPT